MWNNCQEWRRTVEGRGIDELYREIDPFDVRDPAIILPAAAKAKYMSAVM